MNKQIYNEVASELDMPVETVKLAYESYWYFIRNKIKELPLKDDLTKEEFDKLKVNFNIPSLGKLGCSYEHYLGMKKRQEYLKNKGRK